MGSHHHWLSRYHWTVCSRPSAKWTWACQPSSFADLVRGEAVAAVVALAVGHVLDQRLVAAGQLQDALDDLDVLALVGAADVVGLARPPLLQHQGDGAGEVLHVQPVAHLAAVAVDGQRVAVQGVEHTQRDQLLGVLARPVVVRPPADHRLDPVGVGVGGDQQVAAGLGRAVGRGGVQRGGLGERARVDRAVHLVGGHLQIARHPQLAGRVQQCARADHVGHRERVLALDRAVHVRLGGEVDHRVGALHRLAHHHRVLDPAHHQRVLDPLQVLPPARVGQLVQHHHLVRSPPPAARTSTR